MYKFISEQIARFKLRLMSDKKKLEILEIALIMLADYHAVPLDNGRFQLEYRHYFKMLYTLKKRIKNV